MEQTQTELIESASSAPPAPFDSPAPAPVHPEPAAQVIAPQACPSCGAAHAAGPAPAPAAPASPNWIYALGHLKVVCPDISTEKEFAQVVGRGEVKGTDWEVQRSVLTNKDNLYLARQYCFVLTILGMDTYILMTQHSDIFHELLNAISASPSSSNLVLIIGRLGPIAPPSLCNGLSIPVVMVDMIFSFPKEHFLKSIPNVAKIEKDKFNAVADEIFSRIMQKTGNAGASPQDRAMNYIAVREPHVYARAAEQFARDYSLTSIEVRNAPMTGARRLVQLIFSYTNRTSGVVEKWAETVDVEGQFPFLVTPLSPYVDTR